MNSLPLERVLELSPLLEALPYPTFIVDSDLKLLFSNAAFSTLTGLKPREVAALKTCAACLGLEACPDCCFSPEVVKTCTPGTKAELKGRTRSGEPLRVNLTSIPLVDAGGRVVATLQQLQDMSVEERVHRKYKTTLEHERDERLKSDRLADTLRAKVQELHRMTAEQRQLSARLVGVGRAASLGSLAAGIAHELNNPLSTVMANTEFLGLLVERIQKTEGVSADLASRLKQRYENIAEATLRCSRIARGMLGFARAPEKVKRYPTDIVEVIEEATSLVRLHGQGNAISITTDYPDSLPLIPAARDMLVQVFLNLMTNAAQAMQGAGGVTISVSVPSDDRMEILVSDTGPGIPAEIAERVFNPFATSKEVGEGSGLGLFLTNHIIEQHRGKIELERGASSNGTGATFKISLPIIAEPHAAALRSSKVLVVDDDLMVLGMLETFLKSKGYEVTITMNPKEALGLTGKTQFDLVLVDENMPHLNGSDLCRAVRERGDAGTPVVLMSATVKQDLGALARECGASDSICKPFDLDELHQLISRLMAHAA